MADRNLTVVITAKVVSPLCEGLPAGATCITGMLYEGCMDDRCWNEACTYLGVCTDPRHDKKDEEHAEDQA